MVARVKIRKGTGDGMEAEENKLEQKFKEMKSLLCRSSFLLPKGSIQTSCWSVLASTLLVPQRMTLYNAVHLPMHCASLTIDNNTR